MRTRHAPYLKMKTRDPLQKLQGREDREIDIVAREHDYTCFIEVKGRKDDAFGFPRNRWTIQKEKDQACIGDIYDKQQDA